MQSTTTNPPPEPLRFSSLKRMAQSPAHYRHYLTNPQKQTKPMLLGDALDALVFGHKELAVFDGKSRRGEAWTNFADEHPEAVLLLAPEHEQVKGMAASVQANKQASELLTGTTQETIRWNIGQRECRGTPDAFTQDRLVELKTTRNANPYKFMTDGRYMGYHAQLVWYFDGLRTLGKIGRDGSCLIVAVESSPPFPVTIFQLTQRAIIEGSKLWNLWFNRLMVCEESNLWPAYSDAIVPFETPDTEGLTLKIDGEEMEIE